MPRKRKTPLGANAQPIQVAAGGAYGSRQASEEMQRAAPITAASQTPGQGAPVTPVTAADRYQAALQAALDHPAPSLPSLSSPSQRPDEPFTAGLDIGPGPGRDPFGLAARLSHSLSVNDLISALAQASPTPEMQQLAAYVEGGRA